MNLQKHLHCGHRYSIYFSETYTVQNNCRIVFSVIVTFILIPCAYKKHIYNIYKKNSQKYVEQLLHKILVASQSTSYNTRLFPTKLPQN